MSRSIGRSSPCPGQTTDTVSNPGAFHSTSRLVLGLLAAQKTFAANVLPIVRQIQASGVTTFRAIAAALNNRGVRTARGGVWHDSTVRNLLARG